MNKKDRILSYSYLHSTLLFVFECHASFCRFQIVVDIFCLFQIFSCFAIFLHFIDCFHHRYNFYRPSSYFLHNTYPSSTFLNLLGKSKMGSLDHEIHVSKRRKMDVDLIDRLSNLPDHILQHILSSLNLKDRAQTSALAKQWRYIWLGVRNIRVDQTQFVGDDDQKPVRNRKMKKFTKVIDHVMSNDTSLDTLDISITVAVDSNTLNLWILRAMRRNVQRITLSILKENYNPFCEIYI